MCYFVGSLGDVDHNEDPGPHPVRGTLLVDGKQQLSHQWYAAQFHFMLNFESA